MENKAEQEKLYVAEAPEGMKNWGCFHTEPDKKSGELSSSLTLSYIWYGGDPVLSNIYSLTRYFHIPIFQIFW